MSSLFNDSKEQLIAAVREYFGIPTAEVSWETYSKQQKKDLKRAGLELYEKEGFDGKDVGPDEPSWSEGVNDFCMVHHACLAATSILIVAR